MIVSTTKMTAKQFLQLGEDPPGIRLELVNGEIAVSPSPTPDHSFVVFTLARILGAHIEQNDLGRLYGDVDTIFGEHDVRRPDVIYFSKDRLHLIGGKAMEGPPDLCVEVISPSSIDIDTIDKFKQYEAGGVINYWLIDTAERTLDAYQLKRRRYVSSGRGKGSDTLRLPPFPDLELPLTKLWHPAKRNKTN